MVFRDVDYDVSDIILREPGSCPKPCFQKSGPRSSPVHFRSNRQSLPLDGYLEASETRSRNASRNGSRSRCESPVFSNPATPRTARVGPMYYSEQNEKASNRPARYKTSRPGVQCRDDEAYVDKYEAVKREPRSYTITKCYQPVVYENIDKSKIPHEADILPTDRIYEIRKEKILIKADRSMSPPQTRIRSKSSDRYLEAPKNVRIVEDEYYIKEKGLNEELNEKHKVQSRSSYYLNNGHLYFKDNDRQYAEGSSYFDKRANKSTLQIRDDYEDLNDSYRYKPNGSSTNINNLNSSSNNNSSSISNSNSKSQAILNTLVRDTNEIIYVPMVKEEFIKRESQKLGDRENSVGGINAGTSNNVIFKRF